MTFVLQYIGLPKDNEDLFDVQKSKGKKEIETNAFLKDWIDSTSV